jgi:hypothetical protein
LATAAHTPADVRAAAAGAYPVVLARSERGLVIGEKSPTTPSITAATRAQ